MRAGGKTGMTGLIAGATVLDRRFALSARGSPVAPVPADLPDDDAVATRRRTTALHAEHDTMLERGAFRDAFSCDAMPAAVQLDDQIAQA